MKIFDLKDILSDRYRIVRQIGAGGMATVYLARDVRHERDVAVKVLRPDLAATIGTQQFLHEIQLTAALQHPHILPLFDSGEANGLLYYVMPFVEGQTLRARLEREEQLPIEDALHIAATIAGALDYAHRHDVIHCDLKPENILLHEDMPLLMDFGIARAITRARSGDGGENRSLGTPEYMSPEQVTGDHALDGRSDIYSLAALTYEMLTGSPPHGGSTAEQVIARKMTEAAPRVRAVRPTVPAPVDAAIAKGLQKLPADRWQTALQFMRAITPPRLSFDTRTKRRLVLAAAVAMVSLLGRELWLRRPLNAASLNRSTVAVLPFRTSAADPSVRYLGEGMTDLLGTLLTGDGGPRALESNRTLFTWRRAGGTTDRELAPSVLRRIGRDLAAGYVVTGEMTGPASRMVLTASLLDVGSGVIRSHARAEGPADSASSIVERLFAELLVRQSGEFDHRLAALTTQSSPALRAYLAGRAAMRRDDYPNALLHLQRALAFDSTFALAAIAARTAAGWTYEPPGFVERVERLAWSNRLRLSDRDRLLIEWMNPARSTESFHDHLSLLERTTGAAPDYAQVWMQFGDGLVHGGGVRGVANWRGRAEHAFRQALALDTTGDVEALNHLLELAAEERSRTKIDEYMRLYQRRRALTANSSDERAKSAGPSFAKQWLVAMASGDSATVRVLRTKTDSMLPSAGTIAVYAQYHGLGLADAERSIALLLDSGSTALHQQGVATLETRKRLRNFAPVLLRNRGRFARAHELELLEATRYPDGNEPPLRYKIQYALYWDAPAWYGEAAAVEMRARVLLPAPWGKMPSNAIAISNLLAFAQWRIAKGDTLFGREVVSLLRKPASDAKTLAPKMTRGGTLLLETLLAERENKATLRSYVDSLETFARLETWSEANPNFDYAASITAARVWLKVGEPARALTAIRRRAYITGPPQPLYHSTMIGIEARLCARTGDIKCALEMYRQYLALRSDPDPALRPQRDSMRAEYEKLNERR